MAKSFNPSFRSAFNRAFTVLINNPDVLLNGKQAAREAILNDPQFARQWSAIHAKFNDEDFVNRRFNQLSDAAMSQVAQSNDIAYIPDEDELEPPAEGGMMY